MPGGRPVGSKNASGHAAGGSREGAGRKERSYVVPPGLRGSVSMSRPASGPQGRLYPMFRESYNVEFMLSFTHPF